ncbi:MAG: hypothetical protein ACO1TE_01640 [Prosthecobacter sp.]
MQTLPEGPEWIFEIKWDGYRCEAVKNAGSTVALYSRNEKRLNDRFPALAAAFAEISGSWVPDGEVVAIDRNGRPSFQLLQNSARAKNGVVFYAFDLLSLNGVDMLKQPIETRHNALTRLLKKPLARLLAGVTTELRLSPVLQNSRPQVFQAIKGLGMEGVVGKRLSSRHEPDERSGVWVKMRANREQVATCPAPTGSSPSSSAATRAPGSCMPLV